MNSLKWGSYALVLGAVEEVMWQPKMPTRVRSIFLRAPAQREKQMDEEMQAEVEGIDLVVLEETRRILLEWVGIGEPSTPEAKQELVETEALRLQGMIEAQAERFEQQDMTGWSRENPGQIPSFETASVAKTTAWRAAREMILEAELYPQVTDEIKQRWDEFFQTANAEISQDQERARLAGDQDRWKTLNVRSEPEAVRVVERVWLNHPAWFRQLAQALIAQRLEDGQPVPITHHSPLAPQLEEMIDAEIAANPPADPDLPF